MSNIEPYIIIGQEIANIEIGSIKKPKFFKITSGERQKKSLLYHAKIGQEYFIYKLNTINRKSGTLKCAVQGCFAKAYTKIQPDLIIEVADGKKRPNGTTRKAFKVDYSNPRMRDLESYDFYEKCSPNHNQAESKSACFLLLLDAVKLKLCFEQCNFDLNTDVRLNHRLLEEKKRT